MSETINILHLSDLHFGRIDLQVLHKLEAFILARKSSIHLTLLTGDLTQRAKSVEFKEARIFLETLEGPLFLVPGNHDVPLYNLYQRLFTPYRKFLKYFSPFSSNYYEDDKLAIFGLWTTDSLTASQGRIRKRDLEQLQLRFEKLPEHKIKIIAAHHPLLSLKHPKAQGGLNQVMELKPHLMLWGHEHHAQVKSFAEDKKLPILIASGTSASTRTRLQNNSFNYICIEGDSVKVEIYQYHLEKQDFECVETFNSSLKQ